MTRNLLAEETSPYLLQHKDNPVYWRPWGAESMAVAKRENKPILLSIGYAACHWCHVMAHESFEDDAIAGLMNELFVSIKVDREERPDIDAIYQSALQMMGSHGGWPLTMFLTPDGEPFWGGTYFPATALYGRPAFPDLLKGIADTFRTQNGKVLENAKALKDGLSRLSKPEGTDAPTMEKLDQAAAMILRAVDPYRGGTQGAPKFPQPVTLEFSLRVYARTDDRSALEMVTHTLHAIARGGIHDHLAGGFHRYSVDARWLVPHFEKMLYDNALLARLYLQAFQATGDEDLRDITERTLEHLLTDMRSPEGGFYSALDADSEGEEGVFYVWTVPQIRAVLDRETAELLERCYGVSEGGNFEGRSILYLPHDLTAVAGREGLEPEDLRARLREARGRLLAARNLREPPFRDEKILASWNGMAARALAEAGGVLGHEGYSRAAIDCLDFLLGSMRREGRLLRSYKDGTARVDAFLEDYGAVGNALLTTYETTLDPRWLGEVRWVTDQIVELFWDDDTGLFFDTPPDQGGLIVRPRDLMDNAVPSGNSLATELLLRTSHLFGDARHQEIAERVLQREAGTMARYPSAFGRLLSALDRTVAPPTEIAIVGDPRDPRTAALLQVALRAYLPNRTLAGATPGQDLPYSIPLLAHREAADGHPTAYVCERYTCKEPVIAADALAEQLRALTVGFKA